MSKLVFDKTGERKVTMGAKECILFVKKSDGTYAVGIAWNGLTKASHSPEGGEATALYADDIKYGEFRSAESVKGSAEFYMTPDEFYPCMGYGELHDTFKGVKVAQQKHVPFAICYKTTEGDDEDAERGYKLHIYYNCTANPVSKEATSMNESPEAATFSIEFTTTPEAVDGKKPTAYIEIDSQMLSSVTGGEAKLARIIDALYGKDASQGVEASDPTLLKPNDILAILNEQ